MAQNGTVAYVSTIPNCNFNDNKPAEFDFRTSGGSWAYGCMEHYELYRMHSTLGVGKGQKLELHPTTDDAA